MPNTNQQRMSRKSYVDNRVFVTAFRDAVVFLLLSASDRGREVRDRPITHSISGGKHHGTMATPVEFSAMEKSHHSHADQC
jgi:hypothetical protein